MAGSLEFYQMHVNLLPKFSRLGEKEVGRITMLCLYCANQRNGGVIKGCSKWNKKDWLLEVGISSKPQDMDGFYHWEGNDLIIDIYNVTAEEKATKAKERAQLAAEARWEKERAKALQEQCNSNASADADVMQVHMQTQYTSNANCNAEESRVEKSREEEKSYAQKDISDVAQFPRDASEVERFMSNQQIKPVGAELRRCAASFYDEMSAAGWRNKHNHPVRDWRPLARKSARVWFENDFKPKKSRHCSGNANEGALARMAQKYKNNQQQPQTTPPENEDD